MNKKGFTLVELLAVIVILSLIIVIVATNGFGAFDSSKEKINELAEKEINEAINVLMTDIEYCDDNIDSEFLYNLSYSTCEQLQKESSDYQENNGITITLNYLISNEYVTGKNAVELHKTNPEIEYKIQFILAPNAVTEDANGNEIFNFKYTNKNINLVTE